jgi:putative transposase
MRRSRFSEEQIIGILREVETGRKIADVCRDHGISQQTYHRWKAKYGGLDVNDARRLKPLEDENRRLKKLVADLSLDKQALKDVLSRKW